MFLDEAELASLLDHPNCVEIYDLGKVQAAYYISMEYIFGESLWGLLSTAARQQDPLPPTHVAAIITGACDGLHYAHELKTTAGRPLNVVHRDVSPQNIMISFGGRTKVVDFGVAKAETGRLPSVTGQVKGKFSYMSPEQIDGRSLDRRSDIFSLGIVMFESLTSRRLFRGHSPEAIASMILERQTPRLKDVVDGIPQALDEICARALSADPDDRYATADEMATAIRQYLADAKWTEGTEAISNFMVERFGGSIKRRRSTCAAVVEGDYDPESVYATLNAQPVRHVDLYYEWPTQGFADSDQDELSISIVVSAEDADGPEPAFGNEADSEPDDEAESGALTEDLSELAEVFGGAAALSVAAEVEPLPPNGLRRVQPKVGLQLRALEPKVEKPTANAEVAADSEETIADPDASLREAAYRLRKQAVPKALDASENVASTERALRTASQAERVIGEIDDAEPSSSAALSFSFDEIEIEALMAAAGGDKAGSSGGHGAAPGSSFGEDRKSGPHFRRSSARLKDRLQASQRGAPAVDSMSSVWMDLEDASEPSFDPPVVEKASSRLPPTLRVPPPPPQSLPTRAERPGVDRKRPSPVAFRSPIEIGPQRVRASVRGAAEDPVERASSAAGTLIPPGSTRPDPSALDPQNSERRTSDPSASASKTAPMAAALGGPPKAAIGLAFAVGLMLGLLLGLLCARLFLLPLVIEQETGVVTPSVSAVSAVVERVRLEA